MANDNKAIPEDRELTTEEVRLVRWMLEHSTPDAGSFVDQLPRLRVVSRCACGCASIDFSIDGAGAEPGGMQILSDYFFGNDSNLCGVFVFAIRGNLAGLEVYGLSAAAPSALPEPHDLRLADFGASSSSTKMSARASFAKKPSQGRKLG